MLVLTPNSTSVVTVALLQFTDLMDVVFQEPVHIQLLSVVNPSHFSSHVHTGPTDLQLSNGQCRVHSVSEAVTSWASVFLTACPFYFFVLSMWESEPMRSHVPREPQFTLVTKGFKVIGIRA